MRNHSQFQAHDQPNESYDNNEEIRCGEELSSTAALLIVENNNTLNSGGNSNDGDNPNGTQSENPKNPPWIVGLAILFESITCMFRFGFHMESTRDTSGLGRFTFGVRIHHGYIGLVLLLAARYTRISQRTMVWCIRIGWALVISDLTHHFLVLWPITGSPHFDLVYPKR